MKSRLKIMFGVLCICALSTAHSAQLARLFFTPAQRAQLDAQQLQGNSTATLTINGIVQKQGGTRTAWINGSAHIIGKSDEQHPASLPLTIPTRSQPISVKVGQKIPLNFSH